MAKRKYELNRRAEHQEETRQRIIEATVHLHQTVGGRGASISAIAQEAGVERLTVYRHFPDERTLLLACTSHYQAQNPLPDPAKWQSIVDQESRLNAALRDIYAYHRQTEAMTLSLYRDIDYEPVLGQVLEPYFSYWASVVEDLTVGVATGESDRVEVRAAIALGIHFFTWRTLVREQHLEDEQAVKLMVKTVMCLTKTC